MRAFTRGWEGGRPMATSPANPEGAPGRRPDRAQEPSPVKEEGVPARPVRPHTKSARGNCDRKPAPRARRIPARTTAALLACALAATACAAGPAATHQARPSAHPANPTGVALPQVSASRREHVPSALYGTMLYGPAPPGLPRLPRPLVNLANIMPGGPPPDGIPAIDHPRFLRPAQVNFPSPSEPVLALQIGADARAYPVQILIWHDLANDPGGGAPVAPTYRPLCTPATAYHRHDAGRVLSFGTSGILYDSNLLMYDRQTQSLWVQFTGQAIAGVLIRHQLRS